MNEVIEGLLFITFLFCPFGLLALLCGWGTQAAVRRGHPVGAALTFLPIQALFVLFFFVPQWDEPSTSPFPWLPVYALCFAACAAYLAACVFSCLSVIRYGKKKASLGSAAVGILLLLLMLALGYYFRNMS